MTFCLLESINSARRRPSTAFDPIATSHRAYEYEEEAWKVVLPASHQWRSNYHEKLPAQSTLKPVILTCFSKNSSFFPRSKARNIHAQLSL